jgi:hypothetical protein
MKHLTDIYDGEPFNFEMIYSGKYVWKKITILWKAWKYKLLLKCFLYP